MWYSRWTGSKFFIRDKHRLWYLTPNLKNSFLNVILMSTKFPFTYLFFTDRHDHVGFYTFLRFHLQIPRSTCCWIKDFLTNWLQSVQLLPSTFFSKVCLSIVLYIFLWFVYIPLDCVNFSFLSFIGAVLLFMFYSSFNFVIHVTCDNDNKGIILFYSILFLSTSINFPNINLWFEITKILNTKINQCFIRNGSKIILIMHPNEWMKNIRSWGLLMSQGLWENTVQFLMQLQLFF